MLAIRGIRKTFQAADRQVVALDYVSGDMRDGEFLSLVGPGGCGQRVRAVQALRTTVPA